MPLKRFSGGAHDVPLIFVKKIECFLMLSITTGVKYRIFGFELFQVSDPESRKLDYSNWTNTGNVCCPASQDLHEQILSYGERVNFAFKALLWRCTWYSEKLILLWPTLILFFSIFISRALASSKTDKRNIIKEL